MRNFFIQAYSTYRGLFAWLNWPGYISGTIIYPFSIVISFSIIGRFTSDPAMVRDYSLGIAVVSMAFIITSGITQSYQYDRTFYGTIAFLFASPANRLLNFLSRSVFHFPNGIISFIVGLLAAWLVADLKFDSVYWPGFITAIVVVSISISAFGQLLGIVSIALKDWIGIQNATHGVLVTCCGAIIPLNVFPDLIRTFAWFLPVTKGLIAIRESFAGINLSVVSDNVILESLTALIYYTVAYAGFRWFEVFVKRKGTLDRDSI